MKREGHNSPERGQAMLEVALLLPMLLLLALGVIELGRYAYMGILVGNAARAGAAYGAQSLPQSVDLIGIQTAADNDFQNGQNLSSLTVTSSVSCGCDSNGTVAPAVCSTGSNVAAGTCTAGGHWVVMVSVTASGSFSSLFKYPGIPSPFSISKTATLRVGQ